jgi:hypothetical protein
MLGTAMISLSVVNFRRQIVDKNVKTSFYLAEAGLEEAYAVIGKDVEKAIEAGNTEVKNKLENFIKEERKKEESDPKAEASIFINGTDGYEEVNKEKIKPVIEEWFRLGFAKYINGSLEGKLDKANKNYHNYGTVDKDIDNKQLRVNKDGNVEKYNIQNDPITVNSITGEPSSAIKMEKIHGKETVKPYEITLKSTFTHKNIVKEIKGTFTIEIPPYNAPYYVKNVKAKLNENILWKNAITTESNLYVTGTGDVTIDGNIYAYGTKPEDKKKSREFGGIVVGKGKDGQKEEGHLTINGNVATSSYIHTNYDNSSIEINNGDVYCNSLVAQEGTKDTNISIKNGSLNTEDDIELNGENARISINGSYYGFSDGSHSKKHNESSSIVINSPDIGKGSSLTIDGDKGETSLYEKGIYIGGTVYINNLKDSEGNSFDYQTGESLSIKGNYRAYGEYLKDDGSVTYSNDPTSGERDIKFKPDNIELENYEPLVLIRSNQLDSIEKSKYFSYYNEDYKGDLNLGGSSGITLVNVKHNTGAIISGGNISEGKELGGNSKVLIRKYNDYRYSINKMSDPIFPYKLGQEEVSEELKSELEEIVSITDRFNFSENFRNIIRDKDGNIKEVVLVNNLSNEHIAIKGPGGNDPGVGTDNCIHVNDGNLKGIIVTKGDVYITGKLNYTGTIVAKGNIYIQDNNPKTITNTITDPPTTEKYIWQTVYTLDGTTDKSGVKKHNLKDKFKNNGKSINFLFQSEAGVDDTKSYLKYEDIINVHWEQVK